MCPDLWITSLLFDLNYEFINGSFAFSKLLALNMFTHGANVRKTTTLPKFSRGHKCDQTLNSREFAWSVKYGQNPSLKQVCSSSTSHQTHIFVQFFAQVAIYNQKSNFAWASKRRQIS